MELVAVMLLDREYLKVLPTLVPVLFLDFLKCCQRGASYYFSKHKQLTIGFVYPLSFTPPALRCFCEIDIIVDVHLSRQIHTPWLHRVMQC